MSDDKKKVALIVGGLGHKRIIQRLMVEAALQAGPKTAFVEPISAVPENVKHYNKRDAYKKLKK